VYTPTLSGLSDRRQLLSRDLTLGDHIQDVVDVFRREQIENAILCGHSYGGWVISGAVETVESQVSSIVFLDAHVPKDGQSGVNTSTGGQEILECWERGEVSRPVRDVDSFVVKPANRQWITERLTPQPLSVSLQPIHLTGARERIASRTYIKAMRYPPKIFFDYLEEAERKGWHIEKVNCGHEVMVDEPEWLADVLLR
jgi:pimeloyl-ACP methyl ester carboxylesterase